MPKRQPSPALSRLYPGVMRMGNATEPRAHEREWRTWTWPEPVTVTVAAEPIAKPTRSERDRRAHLYGYAW